MLNTLVEVKKKIEYFADNHQNINQFEAQELSKFSSTDNKYPLLWAIPRNAQITEGKVVIPYTIMLVDIRYSDSDLTQLFSDTLITCTELLTYLGSQSDNFSWYIEQNTVFNPIIENLKDNVVGWQGELKVTLMYNTSEDLIQWRS